jgi:glutamyl-tRNA synthetase
MSEVITRFAPSPTGLMHLGNVRTALLNWLFARKNGGRFLLRFEDTNQDRSELQFVEAIKTDLNWLGLDWDGNVLFQSAHAGKHAKALKSLAEQGSVYRCFCSENQLNLDRKLAVGCRRVMPVVAACYLLMSQLTGLRRNPLSGVWPCMLKKAK